MSVPILAVPESPAQTPRPCPHQDRWAEHGRCYPCLDAEWTAPSRENLLPLARDCGAATAARLAPFGSASRRFRRLVAGAGDPTLARDLVGAFCDSYRETLAERRARLAAVAAEDDRQALADGPLPGGYRPWEAE